MENSNLLAHRNLGHLNPTRLRHLERGLTSAAWPALGLALFGATAAAAQAPADSTVYRLDPASVLEVHAGKSGLLAGFGHEHRVRAHAFSGTVVYFPAEPARSRVTITVLTDSLLVVPEADSADIPKITRAMRTETLRVDSFPEMSFISTSIVPLPAPPPPRTPGSGERGAVPSGVRVTGELTMVGRTRTVSIDLTLEVAADTLRAEGAFVVRQTDFGIKPYSKALGMVKVKNDVRIELRVVATRASSPG